MFAVVDVVEFSRDMVAAPETAADPNALQLFPKSDLQIGIFRQVCVPRDALHAHDFTEIVIVDSGWGIHHYEGAEHGIQRGDVFVVLPHRAHTITEPEQLRISNVLFYDDGSIPLLAGLAQLPAYRALLTFEPRLRQQTEVRGRMHLGRDRLGGVLSVVDQLGNALHSAEASSSAIATLCFLQLVKELCDAYEAEPPGMGAALMQVGRAVAYIEDHYFEPIRTADLAGLVNMSLRSFQRHFQHATGMSAGRYITELRVRSACELLKADTNVTEAALEVGFQEPNYFSRAFRRVMGVSPKRYQMECRT